MTTISSPPPPPRRYPSAAFHRPRSSSYVPTRPQTPEQQANDAPLVFQGTDAVPQNHKVALQRVVELHHALDMKHQSEAGSTTSERPTSSSSTMSNDSFASEFSTIPFPDAEVRAFRYFLRMWDRSFPPDRAFDEAIAPTRSQFEEAAMKHFFRRIALWNASEETVEASKRSLFRRRPRNRSIGGELSKLWMVEQRRPEHETRDELKEVTTREGLAQLLWTLLHDREAGLAEGFKAECREALRTMYAITTIVN